MVGTSFDRSLNLDMLKCQGENMETRADDTVSAMSSMSRRQATPQKSDTKLAVQASPIYNQNN